jgi:dsDNA-specific endonuclease/ATPase MutS2
MKENSEILIGSFVRIRGAGTALEVIDGPNKKNKFLVAQGAIRLWIERDLLTLVPSSGRSGKSAKGKLKRHSPRDKGKSKFSGNQRIKTCDLHGQTKSQAEEILLGFFDRALRDDVDMLEIIHGIGSGVIKSFVLEFFEKQTQVKNVRADEKNPGVTWIYL